MSQSSPEASSAKSRDAAREREDGYAEDDAGNDQRRQHQHGQRLLAGKFPRSMRNAFEVPTSTDSTVTQPATTQLVQMLPRSSAVGEQSDAPGRRNCRGTNRA